MKTGKKIKVDYKELSDECCKVCNRPLKKNSEIKGHTMCFVCFKISVGKETDELLEKQKKNFRLYKQDIKANSKFKKSKKLIINQY